MKTKTPLGSTEREQSKLVNEIVSGKRGGLNFTPKQTDRHITIWEGILAEAALKVQELKPDYEEAERIWKEQSERMNAAQQELTDAEGMVQMYKNYRNNVRLDKPVRTLAATSATEKPPKESNRIPWIKLAQKALKELGSFQTINGILKHLKNSDPFIKDYLDNPKDPNQRTYIYKLPGKLHIQFRDNAILPKGGGKWNVKYFSYYNEMFGLPEWLDDNGQPIAKYLLSGKFSVREDKKLHETKGHHQSTHSNGGHVQKNHDVLV